MKQRALKKSSKNLAEENTKTAPLPRNLESPPLEENSYLHFCKDKEKPIARGQTKLHPLLGYIATTLVVILTWHCCRNTGNCSRRKSVLEPSFEQGKNA
jgi:hypothetical protein